MITNEEIIEIAESVNDNIWDSMKFSARKAYCCSILSELAYLHIPEYEREGIDRVKIVPCKKYWEIISSDESSDLRNIMSRNGMFNEYLKIVFTIETRKMIIIGIKCKDVLFISLRGTHELYKDNNVNRKISKVKIYKNVKVHSGFFREVSKICGKIIDELMVHADINTSVIFTGHSLGGALASILYNHCYPIFCKLISCPHHKACCYSFGKPRIGNFEYESNYEYGYQYHILNKVDVIPTVPPRIFGYSDSRNEFYLTQDSLDAILIREKFKKLAWLRQIKNKLNNHRIGEYKRQLWLKFHKL